MHLSSSEAANSFDTAQTRFTQTVALPPSSKGVFSKRIATWRPAPLDSHSILAKQQTEKLSHMAGSAFRQRNGDHSAAVSAAAHEQICISPTVEIDAAYVDRTLTSIGAGKYQTFVLFCVSLIWAGDAMEVMVLSYLGPAAACAFNVSSLQQSLLASVVFGGMVLGAACWGILADTFGRKPVLLLSCGVVLTAGLASAAAPTYTVLLLTRCLVGFGLAGAPVAFTLLLEVLPAAAAATWGTLIELAWTAGTVLEASLAWGVMNNAGWRWLLLLSTAPMVLLLIVGTRLLESPRFFVADGQLAAAQDVLDQMAAANGVKLLTSDHDHDQADHRHHDHDAEVDLDGECVGVPPQQQQQQQKVAKPQHAAQHIAAGSGSADIGDQSRQHHDGHDTHQGTDVCDREMNLDSEQQALLGKQTNNSMNNKQQQQQQPPPIQHGDNYALDIDSPKQQSALISAWQRQQQQQQQSKSIPGSQISHHHDDHDQGGPNTSNQLQLLLQELRYAAATLSQQPYASTAALMMFGWATTSFAYYGLVQLVAELHVAAAGAASSPAAADGPQCIDGMLQVPTHDYISVLVTSAAEVPAVAWAAVSANWLGKKAAVCTSLLLTAACLLPCITVAVIQPEGVTEGVGGIVTDVGMFGARLFVMSAFTLMWVFTPELFPTHVRALALGVNNASARIGGLLSPFAAVSLVSAGATAAAEVVLGAALLLACGAVVMVPAKECSKKGVA